MATMTTPELLDVFKNMSVLELNEFLKAFEEEFGVTAAAPVAMAAAPAAGGDDGGAAAAADQDAFDVILTDQNCFADLAPRAPTLNSQKSPTTQDWGDNNCRRCRRWRSSSFLNDSRRRPKAHLGRQASNENYY